MEPKIKKATLSKRCLNLCGLRFGRLKVVGYIGIDHRNRAVWKCVCDCGNTTATITSSLTNGQTKSCGCLNRDLASKRMKKMATKHGMCGTKEHNIWKDMKKRCYQKNFKDFRLYGGRGISVCEEWINDFKKFYDDMGVCPPGMSIDRINTDGNYEKSNCRWATPSMQARNQRHIRMIEFEGKKMCAAAWSEIIGVKAKTISMRKQRGWPDKDALFGRKRVYNQQKTLDNY